VKILPILAKMFLVLFCFTIVLSAYNAGSTISNTLLIPYIDAADAPDIDGIDDDWDFTSRVGMFVYTTNNTPPLPVGGAADLSSWYKVAWNEDGLYFFGSVIDDSVIAEDTAAEHVSDSWEIMIDGKNDKKSSAGYDSNDVQFRWINGIDIEAKYKMPGTEAVWQATTAGYDVEFMIPYDYLADSFYTELEEDMMIGWEVQVNDAEVSGTRQTQTRWWSEDDASWQYASLFGTAKLVDNSAVLQIPKIDVTEFDKDGFAEDDEWVDLSSHVIPWIACAVPTSNNSPMMPDGGAADLSAKYKVAWDDDGIYFFGSIIDDSVLAEDTTAEHVSDSWEIFIDGSNGKSASAGYDSNVVQFRWMNGIDIESKYKFPGTEAVWQATAEGYDVELVIPATYLADSFYTTLTDDLVIGFETQVNDAEVSGARQNQVKWWNHDDAAWNYASLFGTAILTATNEDKVPEEVASNISLSVPAVITSAAGISYSITARSSVQLSIINIAGQVVEVLESGVKDAGTHTASISAKLSNGVYFCKLDACGQTATNKVLLIK